MSEGEADLAPINRALSDYGKLIDENERLKAERDYCQRYYHNVVVEATRLKAERDAARAQAARLAEALRKAGACWRCGGKGEATFSGCHPTVIERPCKKL